MTSKNKPLWRPRPGSTAAVTAALVWGVLFLALESPVRAQELSFGSAPNWGLTGHDLGEPIRVQVQPSREWTESACAKQQVTFTRVGSNGRVLVDVTHARDTGVGCWATFRWRLPSDPGEYKLEASTVVDSVRVREEISAIARTPVRFLAGAGVRWNIARAGQAGRTTHNVVGMDLPLVGALPLTNRIEVPEGSWARRLWMTRLAIGIRVDAESAEGDLVKDFYLGINAAGWFDAMAGDNSPIVVIVGWAWFEPPATPLAPDAGKELNGPFVAFAVDAVSALGRVLDIG